jgi:hypothetical protein
MAIDDEIEKKGLAVDVPDEAHKSMQSIVVHAQIVGLVSWFLPTWLLPLAAGASAALTELSNKRFYARLHEMRDEMDARLREVDETRVNKDWYKSEEFQTMLFEATRQATATADRQKIAMLGNALANGGITDFGPEERKELFLQLIRDLTPQHIAMLRRLAPAPGTAWKPEIEGKDEDLLVLQMLHASGLVTETLKPRKGQDLTSRYGGHVSLDDAGRIVHDIARVIQELQKTSPSNL